MLVREKLSSGLILLGFALMCVQGCGAEEDEEVAQSFAPKVDLSLIHI